MKKSLLFLVVLILLLGVTGCSTTSTTARALNVTYPVLLGPVKTIKGQPQIQIQGIKSHEFDIKDYSHFRSGPRDSTQTHAEGMTKFDIELLKLTEQNLPYNVISIDNVYFGSYISGTWLFAIFGAGWETESNWVGIKGAVYNSSIDSK